MDGGLRHRPTKSCPNTGILLGVNVPKKSVSHFVTRKDILGELDKCLSSCPKATSVVLLGMGGSGKTQLALEYCRRAEADSSFSAVIWIDASSPATIAQSYSTIALKVTGGSQSIVDVEGSMAIVEGALQQQNGKWLAVLDNFDNPKDFQEHSIQYYVPKARNARILFTSRHASSERLGHVIRVSGMGEDESLNLLLKRPTSEATERQQGLAIAEMLGYLALALDQAGAYIRVQCLPLQDFGSHYKRRKKMILEGVPEQWEYRKKLGETERETALSVFITWELSFEQISGSKEERDRKEYFLTLAAHFDNKCISQRYFEAYCTAKNSGWMQTFMTDAEWDMDKYGDIVAECSKLSLVQTFNRQADGVQFSLHPVVGDWLKVRKDRENQASYSKEFTNLLICYLDAVTFDELNLHARQETLLHIDACLQNDVKTVGALRGSALKRRNYSIFLFAWCYMSNGKYNEAEELIKRALLSNEKELGSDHPDTLWTVENLASIYYKKGLYSDAEELCKRVLANKEKKLRPDHLGTLKIVYNLAIDHLYKGRYDEAEELFKRALTNKKKKLGPDHPGTLQVLHDQAIIFSQKGRYNEAEELYKRALASYTKPLGPDHLEISKIVHNLAMVYSNKGRYNEAEELFKRALAAFEKKLGPDHPDTLWTVRNFTHFLKDGGREDEADLLSARFDIEE